MKKEWKNLSIIDKDLTMNGSISSKGNLVIRGAVQGNLVGEKVVIAEEGSVVADVDVSSLTIGGVFEGEVRATEELIILSTGSCTGTVRCNNLTVESGGKLNANVSCLSGQGGVSSDSRRSALKDKKGVGSITV